MRWLAVGLMLLWAAPAISEESGPRPFEHKTEAPQTNEKNGAGPQQTSAPAPSLPTPIINVYTAKHAGEESRCSQPKDWKEWGSFAFCRSIEWIDAERTIAIFTVILGIATGFLWLATQNLVKEAKETSKRELRAYISVTPQGVGTSDREERYL
jgi:hypothetical protein